MAQTVKNAGAGADDDLSAYNLDNYDEEESKGAGEHDSVLCAKRGGTLMTTFTLFTQRWELSVTSRV